jgi:hypothetical protein
MDHVRELEMWLKSFDRYFMVSNLPLTEEERKEANLRDYSEELRIAGDVLFRVSQVCAAILPEEKISYSSFAKYVETSMRQIQLTDSFHRKLQRQNRPDENLNYLMEALLDIRTIILELSALSKLPYLCFTGIGKMIVREIGNGPYLDFFLQRKYLSLYDQIENRKVIEILRSIQVGEYRRTLAAIFLDFFRALRYLNFITAQTQDAYSLKRSVLVFSLLHSDLRLLIRHMEDEFVKRKHPDQHFVQLIESTTYSLSMELRKVMQRELVGAAALQQHDWIFAKIQNSSGILANAIQQVVFSVAQYFDPGLKGAELFPDYVPKLEQSVQLQSDLKNLLEDSRKFETAGNIRQISALVRKIEAFRSGSMKYLMFKDWMNFDNLYHEIAACKTAGNLAFSMHRFVALLSTLLKEVSKRSILQKN